MLSNLAETLSSGVSSETRDINRVSDTDFMHSPHIPSARFVLVVCIALV